MCNNLPQIQLYTQETCFEQTIRNEIFNFWQKKESGTLKTKDKKKLYWCRFIAKEHTKSLLILNGRVESCLKYKELFFELFKQGYNIYSYDHRGQGLSDRLVSDHHIGYVNWFDDYVDDLHHVINYFGFTSHSNVSIFAHSMGGAIALRYQQTHQSIVKTLVLSSPMLGFNLPWQIRPIAIPLTQIKSCLFSSPRYVTGYGKYTTKPFENNPLTHSHIRYQHYQQLYQEQPALQVGGPSYRWVWQSLIAIKQCYLMTRQIKTPILIIQSGDDRIVNNAAQTRFLKKLKKTNDQAEMRTISNAYHELFFEKDEYRTQALMMALHFLDKNMNNG